MAPSDWIRKPRSMGGGFWGSSRSPCSLARCQSVPTLKKRGCKYMTDFTIIDGIAQIHDPKLYETWLDREDYLAAVSASPYPEVAAIKRLLIDFQVALAKMVRA